MPGLDGLQFMLLEKEVEFVVINENFEDKGAIAQDRGSLAVESDATDDCILKLAGVERAAKLIISTANYATTVYVVLSACVLYPNIYIVARSDEDSVISKLEKAGANGIVDPYAICGKRLADLVLNSHLIDFLE